MFPEKLDDAEVLFHTSKDDFGTIYDTTGEVFGYARYLAICKYQNTSGEYYLFQVSDSYEVIGDYLCDSIDACMEAAGSFHDGDVFWIGVDEDLL